LDELSVRSQASNSKVPTWADYSGVAVSSLCAIHCVVTPVLAAVLPQVDYFHSSWVHGVFLLLVVPLAVYAFIKCYGEHGRTLPSVLGGIGLLLLSSFALLGTADQWETVLTVAGSLFLITGHLLNLRFCKHTRSQDVKARGHRDCC
jgi:hypothetical protein